ncbi:MAG: polysaccharide biosynthesis/export family protein [Elusimicrobia bacterium]|nr:polysaccharide biosynthesis/export family protein [Elusimicrobiota bacterium]
MIRTPLRRAALSAVFAAGILQNAVLPALAAEPVKVGSTGASDARINPGDVVSIAVFPAEEYSREVTVQPDGKVELSLIGSLLVKGLTARELQDLLIEKYSKYVAKPQVTVNVRKFSGRRVAIIGEVHTPGYYEYRDGMRLLEVVALAGGLGDNAKANKIQILRYGLNGANGSFVANLKPVLEGDLSRDAELAPGDTIYVPKGKVTISAQWTNTNILPWLSLLTLIASMIILVDQKTK